ncbi:MAG: hypothetical protein ACREUB_08980 [Burkholderiales bacterium]
MLMCINRLLEVSRRMATVIRAAGRRACGILGFGHERERLLRAGGHSAAALLWLAILATPAHADPRSELAQARHELAISEQVLARMTERAEAARSDPAAGPEQRQRLDDQVARVRELVASNRERVRILAQSVDAMPAGGAPAVPGDGKAASALTQAEEIAALEAKLGVSLADFDQLLLEEARRARTRGATGASGSPGGSGGGDAGERPSKASGTGAKAPGAADRGKGKADPQRTAGEPGSPGGRIEGGDPGTTGATAARPPDVGDGSDDDVIARQIRKAAESERDPELREKLWDEYRRYRQGTKG